MMPTRKSVGYSYSDILQDTDRIYIEKTIKFIEPKVGDSVSASKKNTDYSEKYIVISVDKQDNSVISAKIKGSEEQILIIKLVNGMWGVVDENEDRILQIY